MAKLKKEEVIIESKNLKENKGYPVMDKISDEVINVFDKEPVFTKEVEFTHNTTKNKIYEVLAETTMEEKIISFIESKGHGVIKLNDFIKSLYPIPTYSEPAVWLRQPVSRQIRFMLDEMKKNGTINLVNDQYKRLGDGYYEGKDQLLKHFNLNNIVIEVYV